MNPFPQLRQFVTAGRLVAPIFSRNQGRLAAGFLALVAVNLLQLLIPKISKLAIDRLDQGIATPDGLLSLCLFIVLIAVGTGLCRFGWRYLVLGFSRIMERDLRSNLFSHLLTLDRPWAQKHPVGEIMALSSNDIGAIQLAGGMGLIAFSDAVFMTVATLGFMSSIHPGLTMLAVLPMPILVVATSLLSARLHTRFKLVQEDFGRITEFARTSISAIRLVKAHTQEKSQAGRLGKLGQDYIRDNIKLARIHGVLWPASGLIANVCLLIVLWFGGALTIRERITVGDFVAFTSYLAMLTWPMMALGWVVNLFQRGATSLERLQAVFDARPRLAAPAGAVALPTPVREITLSGLSFSYPHGQNEVLTDISLTLTPGLTGLTGPTGSGKSTLCSLLTRLFPVADNSLLFNGIDCNHLDPAAIHQQIAYVPQETILFADTIAANIAFGRPGSDHEAIREAARLAAIDEEIIAMPGGYEARIGERGVQLSGGQRQRLTLARALLLDRPVLLIDDGLSAVDSETEQRIIHNIAPLCRDRICLFVSHRLAPLVHAKKIHILENGRVTASDSHGQLLENNAYYQTIARHQNGSHEKGSA